MRASRTRAPKVSSRKCNHRVFVHSVHMSTFTTHRRLPNSTWAEVRIAHASGIGLRELARSMGIPAGTVLARAKREGWTRRVEAAKSLARQSSPAPVPVMDAAAATMAERGQRHLQRMAGITEKVLPHVESMEPGSILDRIDDIETLDKVARRTYGLNDDATGNVGSNLAIQINIG